MKITVINLANPVIKVYMTGVQGIPGPDGPPAAIVIDETTESLTITDETYLVLKGFDALTITLKDPSTALPVTVMNQGSLAATVKVVDDKTILGYLEFTIAPGNVFQFVPSGDQYYVA